MSGPIIHDGSTTSLALVLPPTSGCILLNSFVDQVFKFISGVKQMITILEESDDKRSVIFRLIAG